MLLEWLEGAVALTYWVWEGLLQVATEQEGAGGGMGGAGYVVCGTQNKKEKSNLIS